MTDKDPKKRNPRWTREETILGLDLYFREEGVRFRGDEDPLVIELSDLLNQYRRIIGTPQTTDLRNPNGVSMKLANFMRLDPEEKASGLANGSRVEDEVCLTPRKKHRG